MPFESTSAGFYGSPFWKGARWASENTLKLSHDYPDKWLAIYGENVIFHGKDYASVKRIGMGLVGGGDVYMFFAENEMKIKLLV